MPIVPTPELIQKLTPKVSPNILGLAEILERRLPSEWTIFVDPFLNGDSPDLALFHRELGVTLVNEVPWKIDTTRELGTHSQKIFVRKSGERYSHPVQRLANIRQNLREIYVPDLAIAIASREKEWTILRGALFFPYLSTEEANSLLGTSDGSTIVFGADKPGFDLLIALLSRTVRESEKLEGDWAEKIQYWLYPPFHRMEEGIPISLTAEQRRHVELSPGRHQRLKGVAGSGKTLVLAQRAANLAAAGKRTLIVTYNITLIHYISHLLHRAQRAFDPRLIEITHFHGFCRRYLSENYVEWPHGQGDSVLKTDVADLVKATFEEGRNAKHRMYDAILIDEGQDYEGAWHSALCKFLSDNNELLFIMDERQNLYQRDNRWADSMSGVQFRGPWRELRQSFRLPPAIVEEANRFAMRFLQGIGLEVEDADLQQDFAFMSPELGWVDVDSLDAAADSIAATVRRLLSRDHVKLQDIVVLAPTHKEGIAISEMMEERGTRVMTVFGDLNGEKIDYSASRARKMNFHMQDDRLKMSTFHSFKGWELTNVIVMTTPDDNKLPFSLDLAMYVAITRARARLFVVNRNPKYHEFGQAWPVLDLG